LHELLQTREAGVEEKPWWTIKDVVARLHAAGYTDSRDKVRRGIDAGHYGQQGEDWHISESGYRYVKPAAVEALIARRRRPAPSE
jgi:hypothetical protein